MIIPSVLCWPCLPNVVIRVLPSFQKVTKGHFTHKTDSTWPLHFKHSCWWERRSWSKFASHYARRTDGSMWMQDSYMYVKYVKSTWIPTWHRMDHVLKSLGLFSKTTSCTMRAWHFERSQPLVYSIFSCVKEDPHETKFIEIAFVWGPGHIWHHTTLEEGPRPHYVILEVCWEGLWTLCFGLSQFHGHGSWLACEVTLMYEGLTSIHYTK